MTLAVRSDDMEHFKSTIVTTAVLITGLVTAAHILHPYDPALETRRAKPARVDAATAWSDPPARVSPTIAADADAKTPRPASFTLLPVAMTARLFEIDDQIQSHTARRAEPARRHRIVQAANRSRSAAIGQGTREAAQVSNPGATTAQAGQVKQGDPIGDLLTALGIGRDKEG